MFETYDLKPAQNRKSFYGKARVIIAGPVKLLQSYDTVVCYLDAAGKLHRTWYGWSSTTARHVDAFAITEGHLPHGINKADWNKMPVEPVPNF